MVETDLISALSHTKRDRKFPLLCWEDALTRSKTISLADEPREIEVDKAPATDPLDAKRFYLSQPPPRPPRTAPFTGEVKVISSKHPENNPDHSVSDSDIIRVSIKPTSDVPEELSELLSKYAPFSEWKFDVYLSDLTSGTQLHTFFDRLLDSTDSSCISIPLSTTLPKGRTIADLSGHRIKVSVTGVWPLRFYLVNTVIVLGGETAKEKSTLSNEEDKDWTPMDPDNYFPASSNAPTTSLLATTRAAQLDGLIHRQTSKKSKGKSSATTPLSLRSVNLSRESMTPNTTRSGSRPSRSAHRPIPSAQKSFQKLLQLKQKSRHEMMSRIEKDQIGIRVLAGTVIFD